MATGHTVAGNTANAVTCTSRYVGNSINLDTALGNLDDSQRAQLDSGFYSWDGAGAYYSIAANALTLLRAGTGYIQGKKVTWTAPQTAAVFTSNSAHWIYIDSTGTIGIATTRTTSLYSNNIILFEVHYDGTDYEVVWENHTCSFDTDTGHLFHDSIGTILTPVDGTNTIGADMTRVATGTGGAADDRRIKMVGSANLNDQGLTVEIPDSAGAALTWKFYYTNGSGNWTEDSTGTEFPMEYNNAGTMTALATSGATDTGLWTCYATKADPNTGNPIYIAVAHTAALANDAAALSVISAGTNAIATTTLFQALEPAQLGHVIVTNNVSGGYISTVNISKSTARSVQSGGGSTAASGISTNTSLFTGGLSSADSNVQLALETLDRLERKGSDMPSAATVDLSTATGGYIHITGTTTITSFGTHTAGHLHQLVFDGVLTLTHNATSLILPGGANITTAAGDTAIFRSEGGGNWRCMTYQPAGALPVNRGGTGLTSVGTAGYSLISSGSSMVWNPTTYPSILINGGMSVWQRGTSFTGTSGVFTADRWYALTTAGSTTFTIARQSSSIADGFSYSLRAQRNSGATWTDQLRIGQALPTRDSLPFVGKQVTLSFWAKCGANYSAASSYLYSSIIEGAGTDQTSVLGFASPSGWTTPNTLSQTNVLTTSWQQFSYTVSTTAGKTQLGIFFAMIPVGTASTNDWFEITGVKLELGAVATEYPFEHIAPTLVRCYEFYQKSYEYATAPGTDTYNAICSLRARSTSRLTNMQPFFIGMRTAPALTFYAKDGTSGKVSDKSGVDVGSTITSVSSSTRGFIEVNDSGAGFTAGTDYIFHYTADAEL